MGREQKAPKRNRKSPLLLLLGALCFTVTACVFFHRDATEERFYNIVLGLLWLACATVEVFRARRR